MLYTNYIQAKYKNQNCSKALSNSSLSSKIIKK